EVRNYIEALDFAIIQLNILPLSNRLLRGTHSVLMQNVRGSLKSPGEFRKSQNWIGGFSLKDATFIPPHNHEIEDLMADLENLLNNDELIIPHLVRIAIAHYQFETIHPFLDGNGRLGRLLITLYLINNNVISRPMLYISDFFERNKDEYYKHLTEVRTKNQMMEWLHFFVTGILETAENSLRTFTALLALKAESEAIIKLRFGRRYQLASDLLNCFFSKPVAEAAELAEKLQVHPSTIYRLLEDFEKYGIVGEKPVTNATRFLFLRNALPFSIRKANCLTLCLKIKKNPIWIYLQLNLIFSRKGKPIISTKGR